MKQKTTIVCILCDSGIKYLSKIFNKDWLNDHIKPSLKRKDSIYRQVYVDREPGIHA